MATLPNCNILVNEWPDWNDPSWLSNHTLLLFNFSENNLQGRLHQNWASRDNQITGVIQESIGNLSNLAQIDLHGNRLTRSVLMSFSNLLNPHCTIVDGNHLSRDLKISYLLHCPNVEALQPLAYQIMHSQGGYQLQLQFANQFPIVNSTWS